MIRIPFDQAIALLVSIPLLLVYGHWLFYNYNQEVAVANEPDMRQCPFCAHIFQDIRSDVITMCPRCHSYIEKETP